LVFPTENIANKELIEECAMPTIEEFYNKHKEVLSKKPELSVFKRDRLGRVFRIRMLFLEGKMDAFYGIQPELMSDVVNSWDKFKAKRNTK
jgi:hypothetical protein